MAAMMKSMSSEDALHVLEKGNLTTPALVEVAKDLNGNKGRLRKQPKGYAGLSGARKLFERHDLRVHEQVRCRNRKMHR